MEFVPRTRPCVGAAHQEVSRSPNIQTSQTCDRHTLSTRIIQTSVCMAKSDILSGFTEHCTEHLSPP